MDNAVRGALEAAGDGDRDALRLKLHPYVRWELPSGQVVRGRRAVLEMLLQGPPPKPPASIELRDGQIYRWTERPSRLGLGQDDKEERRA
jgi:hypothetical protein